MKTTVTKIFLIFSIILFAGCSDFLNRDPLTTISPGTFWKTENDLRMSLNYLYQNMDRSYTLDNQTIDCFANVGNNVSSGTLTPSNTDNVWVKAYQMIRITNDFMENYQNAEVSDEIKNRYVGEALFFRSYFYFNLIKRFGDVPLTLSTLDLDSSELYGERTKVSVILDQILEDLDNAEKYLPLKNDMKKDVGRITKGAVQALTSRVALYFGTYYKFHKGADYNSLLKTAKEASKRLIDSNQYELFDDYRDLFLMPGVDSSEHILSFRYSEDANSYNQRIRGVIVDFIQDPTKHIADAFLCKDGLPIGKSKYSVEYLPLGKEFENRDPRMALTIWKPGDSFRGSPFVPNLSNQTRTGYMFKKYGDENSFTEQRSYIHEILIRYAEVLLMYAESTYELNDEISDADLDISINKLRGRFDNHIDKLPRLTNDFVNKNQLDMQEEIRRERRVELVSESFRYDDLIRWKTAEKELPQEILGAMFDPTTYNTIIPGKDITLNADGFIVVQSGQSRSFDVKKNYLFPLPLREVSLNKNLVQNPKW